LTFSVRLRALSVSVLKTTMPTIRQLPPNVVNQIAAGEVIERPASVVKELLENAVDAGASRVDVVIERGGCDLVRVVDDGCGIETEQLPLAVASHATSKIASADDLFRVNTLGFRGEAMASIASVSRLVLRSRTRIANEAAEIAVSGGNLGAVTPCGAPVGTTVEVRDLFFNTPVRRKFLRGMTTEVGHVSEALARVALACPAIHFTLRHNDRVVHDLPPVGEAKDRIQSLFGDEVADALIAVENSDGLIRLRGYVVNPSQSRANNRMQYLFLNGRAIRDRALQHALSEAFRGLLLTGRYPIAFLHIQMPPEEVDVNVHPTKLEVRFQDGGRLYGQLLSTLRTRFLSTDLTARGVLPVERHSGDALEAPLVHDAAARASGQMEFVAWAKSELETAMATRNPEAPAWNAQGLADPRLSNADAGMLSRFDFAELPRRAPLELQQLDKPWPDIEATENEKEEPIPGDDDLLEGRPPRDEDGAWRPTALQIHDRYLVTESEEGVVVIDQHALHERILYEQLREKVLGGALESQNLLVPEPVDLAPAEAAALLERRDVLARLGIRIEPFGGDTVLVSSYPAMLSHLNCGETLREVAASLLAGVKTPQPRDLIDELLHMISCKAAVKAGDRLTPAEVDALVAARHLCQDAHHCPHGRPTALVFTRAQLDRQFKRT
jgi:DNA mismatch repair protein MutL